MAKNIESFGVVGSGLMGRGIAEVAAVRGSFERVVLHDSEGAQLDAAGKAIAKNLAYLVDKGKLEKAAADRALGCIAASADRKALAGCGFVVEAVTERLEVKAGIFEALGRELPAEAILASNTSSIPITRLAACSGRPDKVIGMHFMNPVPRMKGVEIIRGLRTSPETCRITLELAARFGKEVSVSRDRAGFVVNRILIPMLNDAAAAVDAGLADVEPLDKYFALNPAGPKHPMGPLMLADLIGLDTTKHILAVLGAELGPAFAPAGILSQLVEKGALGAKSGRGFYLWEGGRAKGASPLVAELRVKPTGSAAADPAPMARRAWLGMMNEAVRVVEEGTSSVADVDRACLYCLNQPVGIFVALDKFGVGAALKGLAEQEERFGPAYKPAALLRRLAEAGFGGQGSGAGIYAWKAGQDAPAGVNPVLGEYLG
jgi:3-hydroxybutyryl-CoA dehydrogenase